VNEIETSLLAALRELDTAVATMAQARAAASAITPAPKPNFLPLFERIEALARQLPRATDPTLMHYLQKRSYEKARLYLEGHDGENQVGNCRHV
jgi:hypothetical protein